MQASSRRNFFQADEDDLPPRAASPRHADGLVSLRLGVLAFGVEVVALLHQHAHVLGRVRRHRGAALEFAQNFFPSTDEDDHPLDDGELHLPAKQTGSFRSGSGSSRSASTPSLWSASSLTPSPGSAASSGSIAAQHSSLPFALSTERCVRI
ncbi:hypothetical protein B0H12DRAFT_1136396 [Mycena haematopus]|nr:hypothetical protein B0H12DRAFT_1136396 [Mycena haematopus]